MEWNGSGRTSSCQSEENSLLDLPDVITAESFLWKLTPGRDEAFHLPPPPAIDQGSFPAASKSKHFTGPAARTTVPLWPRLCERMEPTSCENAELFQPNELSSPDQGDEEESTLRRSLDTFYSTCCQKKSCGGSPVYERASQCVSLKMAEVSGVEGMKFTVKSLQMAQLVLNQEESKIFPQPPSSSVCFLTSNNSSPNLEKGKEIPGLSDDILQFILKRNIIH